LNTTLKLAYRDLRSAANDLKARNPAHSPEYGHQGCVLCAVDYLLAELDRVPEDGYPRCSKQFDELDDGVYYADNRGPLREAWDNYKKTLHS
jgi:hypothetical protein